MRLIFAGLAAALFSSAASAAPGLGEKVYGAKLHPGVTELEARYGRLTGGHADGEDTLVLGVAHNFSSRFFGAVLFELEREPHNDRRLGAIAFEGIVSLGHIDGLGLDAALLGEYVVVRGGADHVATRLLLQRHKGPFDGRLNLIAEKALEGDSHIHFGYAASADWAVAGPFRAGAAAFGELGDTEHFLPRADHYVGPIIKAEIEHMPGGADLGIEAGYLFALGHAQDETDGQIRLLLEYKLHF
jgi:hypothetical protein